MLVAHLNLSAIVGRVDVLECISLSFPCIRVQCKSVCLVCVLVGCVGGVDGLSGSPGPGGTALVNNSDEAHYQGSADFSLIPP